MLRIPGDHLEGGGQILRTVLALAVITQKSVEVFHIRAKRPQPGLRAQHFHAIRALKEISEAELQGFQLGSERILFIPHKLISKELYIDIGTAGSIGLLLQALIPVACFSPEGISARIKGGTSGKASIPIEYFLGVILPILRRIGIKVNLRLIRRGYYPKGGGIVEVKIEPVRYFSPLLLLQQGNILEIEGISHAHQDLQIKRVSHRQKEAAEVILKKKFSCPIKIKCNYSESLSLGSGIVLWAKTDTGAILGSEALGEKGKLAEVVGEEAASKLIEEIESGAAVDIHLADNLILYLAFAGGAIRVSRISLHTQTNLWAVEQFFGKIFKIEKDTIKVERRVCF